MDASPSITNAAPGTVYRFMVASAPEAADLIRGRLGPEARVLSVRTVPAAGLRRLWRAPRIEVIAQVAPEGSAGAESAEDEADEAGSQPVGPAPVLARVPTTPTLAALLRRSGVSEVTLARLQMAPYWPELAAAPLHRALVEAGLRLQAEAQARWKREPLNRVAFIGSPGSGRTTALCKWLGTEVFRRGRRGHVVTVEFDRPGSPGPLPLFCEALGVASYRHPAANLPATPGGFVAFDVPSFSISRAEANTSLGAFLDREGIRQRVLVLNAAYDHAALRGAYAAGRALGATHVVFTHLDEVAQWGGLWDYLFERALDPLFLAIGPSLTGDCEEDVFGALVRRTLAAGAGPAPAKAELPRATAASSP
jgi:flagellar biosynthesis protein FlhF